MAILPAKNKTLLAAAAVFGVLAVAYVGGSLYYQNRLLPGTNVLGTNIGGKSPAAAETTLAKTVSANPYKVTDNGKTVASASGNTLGISKDFKGTISKIKQSQNAWSWPAHLFGGSKQTTKIGYQLNTTTLKKYAATLSAKLNTNRTKPVDASMKFTDGKLVVTKETNGNTVASAKLATALETAIAKDQHSIDLSKTYEKPSVTTSSSKFKQERSTLSKISKIKATVTVENHNITIPTKTLTSWLGYANGAVTVSQSGLTAFVKQLNDKYATYQKKRSFNSTKRGTVSVSGGIYGWSISSSAEVASLTTAIKAGKDFTKKVITQGSGYNSDGTDIGNTYVEVDLKNQHEYYYKDGKLVLDSDIVSGKPDGHSTPTGVYYVWSKQRNATLKGENSDGSSYASPVSYWMPIDYTGVGLHDASWQPKFGGTWYKEHGSHGCVNNPPAFMKKLYAAVALGTPVIVF